MKISICIILLCIFVLSNSAWAQTGPTGVWQSDLATGSGEKLNLQFVINKLAGGAYGITMYYPDHGTVKKLPATSVSYKDGKLVFNVDGLEGSYSGIVGNKKITGEWRQGGKAVPMILTPYKRPELSSKDMEKVLGQWVGKVTYPDGLVITAVSRFEKREDGRLVGFVNSPDMGGADTPITDILIEGNLLRFRIPAIQCNYTGEITPEGIVGILRGQDNYESDFNLVRGEYRAAVIRLDITAEEMKKLSGRWVGKLGPISVIFRFEQDSEENSVIFFDIPEQNVNGGRIVKASITNDTLHLAAPGMEYTGKITGDTIDGSLIPIGQNPVPLVLTKE